MSAPVEPKDGTAGRETQPREDQISNREGGEMMELKEATQRLRMHMELLDSAAMPTKSEVFVVCGHSAGQMRDDLATVLEALSRFSLEGGGEKASCTDLSAHVADATATEAMVLAGRDALYRRRYARIKAMLDKPDSKSLEVTADEMAGDARACIEAALSVTEPSAEQRPSPNPSEPRT